MTLKTDKKWLDDLRAANKVLLDKIRALLPGQVVKISAAEGLIFALILDDPYQDLATRDVYVLYSDIKQHQIGQKARLTPWHLNDVEVVQ